MNKCKNCEREAKISFCSRSCSASYNNKGRGTKQCKGCGCLVLFHLRYCSDECKTLHRQQNLLTEFENGKIVTRNTIKRLLLAKKDCCFECGLKYWRGQLLPLEVDHIDGDASNNFPENLRLVCGNCHSITPTWKAKNRGNGRATKGLPLY